jgi:hypothetical protein
VPQQLAGDAETLIVLLDDERDSAVRATPSPAGADETAGSDHGLVVPVPRVTSNAASLAASTLMIRSSPASVSSLRWEKSRV